MRALILVAVLASPAAAQTSAAGGGAAAPMVPGAAGITAILCEVDAVHTDPRDTPAGSGGTGDTNPPRAVRVADPWGEAPMLTGAGDAVRVTVFERERTLIFDAQSEFLYLDNQNHRFSYTLFARDGVTIWRGTCRAEG